MNYQSMTRRSQTSKFLFLFLQAMAVAIICLGSLINFHQYKIWGKPLIPNFIGYKRDIEKYSKILSFSKLTRDNPNIQKYHSVSDYCFSNDLSGIFSGPGVVVTFSLSLKAPVPNRVSSAGLRGPPVS
jgi:hypothetical protein